MAQTSKVSREYNELRYNAPLLVRGLLVIATFSSYVVLVWHLLQPNNASLVLGPSRAETKADSEHTRAETIYRKDRPACTRACHLLRRDVPQKLEDFWCRRKDRLDLEKWCRSPALAGVAGGTPESIAKKEWQNVAHFCNMHLYEECLQHYEGYVAYLNENTDRLPFHVILELRMMLPMVEWRLGMAFVDFCPLDCQFRRDDFDPAKPEANQPLDPKSYYKTLGLDSSASVAEIGTAYRALAKKLHPDKNPGDPNANDKFVKLQEAYEILSDSDKRRAYDTGSDGKQNCIKIGHMTVCF